MTVALFAALQSLWVMVVGVMESCSWLLPAEVEKGPMMATRPHRLWVKGVKCWPVGWTCKMWCICRTSESGWDREVIRLLRTMTQEPRVLLLLVHRPVFSVCALWQSKDARVCQKRSRERGFSLWRQQTVTLSSAQLGANSQMETVMSPMLLQLASVWVCYCSAHFNHCRTQCCSKKRKYKNCILTTWRPLLICKRPTLFKRMRLSILKVPRGLLQQILQVQNR